MRTEGLLPAAGLATKGGSLSYSGSNGNVPHVAGELSATSVRSVPGWKAGLDITCILLLLPLWLPLMILLMLVTRIASPGPIFYRQKRIGLDGRHFFIWKFRTMRVER